jgi:ribonucleoside-diphosphate reductase alpha chain
MAVLSVDHPDIGLFVDAKRDGTSFRNFNFSVGVSDEFMQAVADDRRWALRHPRTRQATREVSAAELFNQIAHAAWQTGDPGLLFLDTINRDNPTPAIGAIEATNPCGEVPLLPFESCNLASINLSRMIRATAAGFEIDWQKLSRLVRLGIRFLDNMVEIGRWPAPQIAAITHANRKVGLGVMGFAELLTLLGIPYASEQAVSIAEQLMRHISIEADAASSELVAQRGVFPHWDRSIYAAKSMRLRNATRTSIAPTGTLSIIAGTSAGIEPLFALAYRRQALDGKTLVELNPLFLRYAQQHGFYSDALVRELSARGSLAGVDGVPEQARRLFQTALEISPDTHLSIQAAFQKHTDNSVSKTINLPQDATATDVAAAYRKAWEMKLKGITVFRYGSKSEQVLQLGTGETGLQREHFVRCDPHDCKL